MKKAIISPLETRETGYRVAQVVNDGEQFEIGPPLFWQDCPDNIVADQFWFDPASSSFKILPSVIGTILKDQNNSKKAVVGTGHPHNLTNGMSVNMLNQLPVEYAGIYSVTIIDTYSFSYIMENEPATDATYVGTYDILDS